MLLSISNAIDGQYIPVHTEGLGVTSYLLLVKCMELVFPLAESHRGRHHPLDVNQQQQQQADDSSAVPLIGGAIIHLMLTSSSSAVPLSC